MSRWVDRAVELRDALAAYPPVVAAGLVVTIDPREAAAVAVTRTAVLIGPPRFTFDVAPPAATVVWTLAVLAARQGDPFAEWSAQDAAVEVLHEALTLDTGTPVTYALPDGGPRISAYELTYTETA